MTTIWVVTTFEAVHRYPDAPLEVSFLKHPHRHLFHVKLEVEVHHDGRELEFILLKRWVSDYVSKWTKGVYTHSCEFFAREIATTFSILHPAHEGMVRVSVSEDGENGATYEVHLCAVKL